MSISNIFLSLSIKQQICITIIGLNIFCILVILSICGSLAYEIIKEDIKQKKLYFYENYQDYIEGFFYFQNFYLLQYEEIIKRIHKQIWEYEKTILIYNKIVSNDKLYEINATLYYTINYSQIFTLDFNTNNSGQLYFTCFSEDSTGCTAIKRFMSMQYYTLPSSFITDNLSYYNIIRIPIYENIELMKLPFYIDLFSISFFSFNPYEIFLKSFELCNNSFNRTKINAIYKSLYNNSDDKFNKIFKYAIIDRPPLADYMFGKIIKEIDDDIEIYKQFTYLSLINIASGFFSEIDYGNNKFYSMNNILYLFSYIYVETDLIDNFLYFINNKLYSFIDVNFIPLYYENNTVLSPDLCILFLLKQTDFQMDEERRKELFEKIVKGKSSIEECLIGNNILDDQPEIKDLININMSYFFFIANYNIYHGIMNLNNSNYYFMKYSSPNYNTLKDFKSDYYLLDQTNYYLFTSFREPIKYTNLFIQISLNCFYLILILIIYIWLICLSINFFIFYKVIAQLIEPIKNLRETIESSSIKDENIFKYDYDDIINELFLTCKELLTGQIDKNTNEKGLDKFNILSISNNKLKDNDENVYSKNLIINNDIMSKLLGQQKSLMDFSKNIKLNEYNEEQNNFIINKNSNISSINIHNNISQNFNFDNNNNDNSDNLNISNLIDNKKTVKNNEEKEKEDREPYKKLFLISEYFQHYLNKTFHNYITINNNNITNEMIMEEQSKMSKVNRMTNRKNSVKINNSNFHKTIKRGDSNNTLLNEDKNISINMLNKEDISYIWYMEAKKKKNQSLNYKIGHKYEELFVDLDL